MVQNYSYQILIIFSFTKKKINCYLGKIKRGQFKSNKKKFDGFLILSQNLLQKIREFSIYYFTHFEHWLNQICRYIVMKKKRKHKIKEKRGKTRET